MKSPLLKHHHAVQFYGNDDDLFRTVAAFLGQGFIDMQPGLIIATPEHTEGILAHMRARLIDVDKARELGDLVLMDAQQTLDLFMDGDMPDGGRFEEAVGGLVQQVLDGRGPNAMLRAYGEMVDLLWRGGRPEAAIRLEMFWNKLANQHGFALLCGYSMGNFFKETLFEQVCAQHSEVVTPRPVQ